MRFRHPSRSNTVTAYDHQPGHEQPGAEPGIDTAVNAEFVPPAALELQAACEIKIIDFSQDTVNTVDADNGDLASKLDEPRPADLPCRWISVNGLSWKVIQALGNKFNLHRLAIEDMVYTHQRRTKVDWYADQAFVSLTLMKLVKLHKDWQDDSYIEPEKDCDEKKHAEKAVPVKQWWRREKSKAALPYYLDKNGDGKVDEFVNAHTTTSDNAPMKPTRTLHRFETQNPVHTAFMEKHSALAAEDLAVSVEQVFIFLLEDNTVISFFEQSADDVEEPILQRLKFEETMLRRSCDASMLLQSIIDGIVDLAVPIKEGYNKARKDLQIDAMTNPNIKTSRALHIFGEEIDMLQSLFKPFVALVNALRDHNSTPVEPPRESQESAGDAIRSGRHDAPRFARQISDYRRMALKRSYNPTSISISPLAHTYFGDVLDHCITMIQALEQMDASAGNISTLIFNTVGARTNNFMMILAVVTVFFAPLTFVTGYFGMNFAKGNGLVHPFAFFWVVAIPSLIGFMLLVFATMLWEDIRLIFTVARD